MTDTQLPHRPNSIDQPIVAITGASGYLGSVLVEAFDSVGFGVRRLMRAPTAGGNDRPFDLNSPGTPEVLEGVDVLVHCAYDLTLTRRSDIWRTNVFGTVALLDSALSAGVGRTIVLSSMSAYGGTRQLYGRAKLAIEIAAVSRGMCVVRPGLVYGPGWGGMAGTLRRAASSPVLPDFGPKAHQFTVREDDFAAAILALAMAERLPSSPVGVAHPDPVPFTEVLTSFVANENKHRYRYIPTPPMAVYAALRAAELFRLHLPVRADSLLGLVRPAPFVPNPGVLDELGIALQPLPRADGGAR